MNLKPCPWCGADALLEHLLDHDNSQYVMISCTGECSVEPYVHTNTEDEAVARWNRRDGTGTECPFCGSQVHVACPPDFTCYIARCGDSPYRKCVMASAGGDTENEALTRWAKRMYT